MNRYMHCDFYPDFRVNFIKKGSVNDVPPVTLKDMGLSDFMDEVEALCDEICILKRGSVVFQGTVKQAKGKSGCEKFEDAYLILSGEEKDAE